MLHRILNNQLELNDAFDRGGNRYYSKHVEPQILEDENGKYKIEEEDREVPCGCHPETCCHGDGYKIRTRRTKKYLREDGSFKELIYNSETKTNEYK